ncbi:MAG: stage II sporulation protein R [Clostridiales bacterium]|nr:stage II sporulation protein R [Clostridiales bacterium]
MKMIKALACGLIFTLIFQSMTLYADCSALRDNTFRLHIIANSDNEYDQQIKLALRDALLKYTGNYFSSAGTKGDAQAKASSHLSEITCFCQKFLRTQNYNRGVAVAVTKMYFTTREYDSFTLPAGKYDALRIVIGTGAGHNWWCVMFPQMCLPCAQKKSVEVYTESQKDLIEGGVKYEYKFIVAEWFESIVNLFS